MIDLSLLFDHDLWATQRMLHALPEFEDLGRAHEIFEEIAGGQTFWLNKVGVATPMPEGNLPFDRVFVQLNGLWKHVVEDGDIDERVDYHLNDEPHSCTMREIAYHVIERGNFSRGKLAQLAWDEGIDGFGNTDLLTYLCR